MEPPGHPLVGSRRARRQRHSRVRRRARTNETSGRRWRRGQHVSLVLLHDADTTLPAGTLRWLQPRDADVAPPPPPRDRWRPGTPRPAAGRHRNLPRARGRRRTRVRAHRGVRRAGGPGPADRHDLRNQHRRGDGRGPGHGLGCRHHSRAGALQLPTPLRPHAAHHLAPARPSGSPAACDRCSATSTSPTSGCRTSASPPTSPRATLMVHDRGPLVDALRASIAIPGVLPPVPHNGDLLVDGGLLDNVPVDEMRRRNPTGQVLAIDVAPVQGPVAARDYGLSVSGIRSFYDRRRGQGPPHLVSTMVRATLLASVRDRERVVEHEIADLYLDVDVEGGGLLDFSTGAVIADAAAKSTRPVLERWVSGELAHLDQHHMRDGLRRGAASASHRSRWPGRCAADVAATSSTASLGSPRSSSAPPWCSTLLFLMSGLTEQFHREPRDTIAALGAERWMVREGATGAFTSAATMPDDSAAAVQDVDASPVLIGRHSLDRRRRDPRRGDHRIRAGRRRRTRAAGRRAAGRPGSGPRPGGRSTARRASPSATRP